MSLSRVGSASTRIVTRAINERYFALIDVDALHVAEGLAVAQYDDFVARYLRTTRKHCCLAYADIRRVASRPGGEGRASWRTLELACPNDRCKIEHLSS